jgi:hypothetical protein
MAPQDPPRPALLLLGSALPHPATAVSAVSIATAATVFLDLNIEALSFNVVV